MVEAVRRDILQSILAAVKNVAVHMARQAQHVRFFFSHLLGIPRFFDALLHLLDCYPVYKASFVAVPCSKKWPLCDQPLLVFVQDGIALHLQNTTLHFKALPNSTKHGILLQRATPVVSSKVLRPVRNAAFCYKAPLWSALRFKKVFADYKVCIIVHFFQREFSVQ